MSKKKHFLVETVPAGPSAARDAERVRTRLLNQVDERRNPRTKATVNQLLDRWLEVAELETTTRNSVVGRLNRHVRPVLGAVPVGRSMLRLWSRSTPNFGDVGSEAAAAARPGIHAGRWRLRRSG